MNNGKICISVCAATADELIEQIKRAEDLADVIEIRFDCLEESEFDAAIKKIADLKFAKPFLATFRPKNEASKFSIGQTTSKNAENYSCKRKWRTERISNWNKIFSLNNLSYIDFDEDLIYAFSAGNFDDLQTFDLPENIRQKAGKLQIIASLHDFKKMPSDISNEFENLDSANRTGLSGEIVKIAAQADDITDTISIWKLLEKAKTDDKQIIPIAMGESGKWTRILGLANNAPLTYAALDSGRETAPGQISARDLIEIYRVKDLDEKTEIYGIIAADTSYSMSPYIHNAAFVFNKTNAVFVPLQVKNLAEFIRRMVKPETREIELNFKGFAVTNPHKREIIEYLDDTDETARKIGAVNTVKIENGKLYGYNTDAAGFVAPLVNAYGDLRGAKVAVFGAGGAARACVYALKKAEAKVTIFARDFEKAKNSAREFGAAFSIFKNDGENYNEFDILVNATPLGTKGESENETLVRAGQIFKVKLVYDLIYNPFETLLMREADKAGVPKIGGLAMLAAQAAAQQKIWTGMDAPVEAMSRAALKRLS